jgi:hypothetical protein
VELPNPKELKRLADMCRKAGIKSFKSPQFEFTLTDDAPVSNYKRKQQTARSNQLETPSAANSPFESDSLGEDELLFWSTGGGQNAFETDEK